MSCKDKDGGTHHNACDCREKYFRELESRNAKLVGALKKIAEDKVRIEYRGLDQAVYEDSEMAKIAKEALREQEENDARRKT